MKYNGNGPVIFEFVSGPIGDVFVFLLVGFSWKSFGQRERYLELE